MKTTAQVSVSLLVVGTILCLRSCQLGQLVSAGKQRVIFAMVIDMRAYNGKTVFAEVLTDVDGILIETVSAAFESYPNTAHQTWAKLTTLKKIDTNHHYFIDIGDSGNLAVLEHFDVMLNAVWSG